VKHTRTTEITKRKLQHGLRARFPRAADLDTPLDVLVEHGYLRPRSGPKKRRPGKQPGQVFDMDLAAIY
jgi:replicative DNA helicase